MSEKIVRKYRNYTNEDVIKYSAEVLSLGQLLEKLGLKPAGGNYIHMKKTLQKLNINCDHWKGQAWNKGEQLKNFSQYVSSTDIKKHLLIKRGHKCEKCNLTQWQGQKIPIELQHISADRTDNRQQNLLLLCCNCHALTLTWRGRGNKGTTICLQKKKYYCSCGKQKSRSGKQCMSCSLK